MDFYRKVIKNKKKKKTKYERTTKSVICIVVCTFWYLFRTFNYSLYSQSKAALRCHNSKVKDVCAGVQ